MLDFRGGDYYRYSQIQIEISSSKLFIEGRRHDEEIIFRNCGLCVYVDGIKCATQQATETL